VQADIGLVSISPWYPIVSYKFSDSLLHSIVVYRPYPNSQVLYITIWLFCKKKKKTKKKSALFPHLLFPSSRFPFSFSLPPLISRTVRARAATNILPLPRRNRLDPIYIRYLHRHPLFTITSATRPGRRHDRNDGISAVRTSSGNSSSRGMRSDFS
jgi:hypothetical protein